jgi:hypothetical protein
MDLDAITERIAAVHRGRRWILTPDVAVAAAELVEHLKESGSGSVMVVSATEGVGELPAADRIHYTRTRGDTVMGGIRAFLDSVEHPSDELMGAVEAFDPGGEAVILHAGFTREQELLGRPIYGARPAAWGALEDKLLIDELCDAAGITRAPSEIVAVAEAPGAAERLASELGSVWVADNTEGWHGGGEYVRWVRGREDVGPAVEWFSQHAQRVRVMPFLDGLPSSIHGFNTGDGTAVFLPVEMIILRHAERPEFIYARAANFWNPPDQVRDEMRDTARRMGALLHQRVGYRGGFGIDGVTTADGFRPTELNPRLSLGHFIQARPADVPLASIERLLIAGDLELPAADLEETVVSKVETVRGGGTLFSVPGDRERQKTGVVFTEDGAEPAEPEGTVDATMELGPAPAGSIVIMRFDPQRNPIGPSAAPRALRALRLAAGLWDVDVPPMVPAPDPFSERSLQ